MSGTNKQEYAKKLAQEYVEKLSEDPSDLDEDQKAAVKIAAIEAKYEKAFAEMNAKLEQVELEKQAAVAIGAKALAQVAEAGASAVTPGSGKKVNWTSTHQARHDEVVLVTAPVLLELKNLQNKNLKNYHDIIWWCAKHIEALGIGDKPEWHDSYKKWAADHKNEALHKYIPFVEDTTAAGSP